MFSVVLTPPADDTSIGLKLPISVHQPQLEIIHTKFTFTYRNNPTLSRVYPLETVTRLVIYIYIVLNV